MTYLIAIAIIAALAVALPKLAGWAYLAVGLAVFIVAELARLGVDRAGKPTDNEGMTNALTPLATLAACAVAVAILAAFMMGRATAPQRSPHRCESPCWVDLPKGTAEDSFGLDYVGAHRAGNTQPVLGVFAPRAER